MNGLTRREKVVLLVLAAVVLALLIIALAATWDAAWREFWELF